MRITVFPGCELDCVAGYWTVPESLSLVS
ncbi:unnamed protein product [Thlaspi arvense]|uniref:Uncharacterized protein n=1 Tax=Thlaspi arvense TaxID=13288 RepID=A0AAU9T193_THLAR|nr:unnamed protein product [Thlaspi arvense]